MFVGVVCGHVMPVRALLSCLCYFAVGWLCVHVCKCVCVFVLGVSAWPH